MSRAALVAAVIGLAALIVGVTVTDDDGRENARVPSPTTEPEPTTETVDIRADGETAIADLPPVAPDEFPTGVWFESITGPTDVVLDRTSGLNTYVVLTPNSDLSLVEPTGMRFLAQQTEWLDTPHPTIAGWELYDEIDMQREPAAGCAELADIIAGLPADGRIRFNNFGKGVAFWQTDAEAECYVNTPGLDVVSVDTYWFTDENVCGPSEGGAWFGGRQLEPEECHLAANYGLTVDRIRYLDGLDGDQRTVWAMVEVGHPFAEEDWPTITPDQVRAAVWHSVIAGAEGIVYFNHSFGGPCPTQHALREPCYEETRAMVATVNGQLHELAPVLAGTPADDVAADGPVRITARHDDEATYIVAGATTADGGEATFTASEADTVEVMFEDRTLTVTDGQFSDSFADGNAVHIYRVI